VRGIKAAALAAVTAALAGCSGSSTSSSTPNQAPQDIAVVRPAAAFTAKTLPDWKTFGDAIDIVEIVDSKVDHSAAADPAKNGGTIGRLVQVSVLNRLWQRPGGPIAPTHFSMRAWGWVPHGNDQRAIVARGEPRLETNHVYLLVLGKFQPGWAALGDGAEMPFDNGVAGAGEWAGKNPDDDQPGIRSLLGKSAAEVQAILDTVQPDPRSTQYNDLDPIARAKKLGKTN
jgi:hypothetical protein